MQGPVLYTSYSPDICGPTAAEEYCPIGYDVSQSSSLACSFEGLEGGALVRDLKGFFAGYFVMSGL